MSEILLTPLPVLEPVSPIDPDIAMPKRITSQSAEFFDSLYMDGVRGHTRPLQVKKKPVTYNRRPRTSTVSVPSSPTSFRSAESVTPPRAQLHPHQTISDMFMALDLQRNPSTSGKSEMHLALGVHDQVKPGPSPPLTPLSPRQRKTSIPLTPITPARPRRRIPGSPVTPTRAPSKAMKLLGTCPPALPSKQSRKKRDHFRPLPHSTLLEINSFFGSAPKKPSSKPSKSGKSAIRMQDENRNVGAGETVTHKGEDGHMWFDIEEEQEFAWLMSDHSPYPGRARSRTEQSSSAADETEDESWGMKAFTSVLSQPTKPKEKEKGKRVEDSFNDMFADKPKPKPRRQARTTPHPWSAAGLAQDTPASTPPALVSRLEGDSSSSSSSGLSSPETASSPPRRPKHRPPPLILDVKPKAGLPIVILNSPPIQPPPASKRLIDATNSTQAHARSSTQSAQTPLVHPRRAPKPRAAIGLGHPPLPRSTDTRMPLLPPVSIYTHEEDEELEISCFEPITPEDKYFGHHRSGSAERRGGWLKKVVRDLSHGKI